MKIGFFTDTYFPQVSGVSTSIRILKEELEALGHEVYIFTTTDPNVKDVEPGIFRMPSIPFVSFKERRIIVRGMLYAYYIAKEIGIDLVHTHTEFGLGILGKQTAKSLGIPCIHTYHTMYEDYLHYIAKGKIIRPSHVRQLSKLYTSHLSGIVCPSERVEKKLLEYGIDRPMAIIPTGVKVGQFTSVPAEETKEIRDTYGIKEDDVLFLSVSRISYEKNIQAVLKGMPTVKENIPNVKLLIVGDGPYKGKLEALVEELSLSDTVIFTGEIENEKISPFYQAADYLVSASDSETQGLTYTESMAARTKVIAKGNDYLNHLLNDISLGMTYLDDEDFAGAAVDYVTRDVPNNPVILDKKLYDISSQAFGKRMEEFYEETIKYYEDGNQDLTDIESAYSLKLFKK
ncbi:glycosyltransferase family 4 protein [Vagococcus jeotgali]|uniref:glycosyltransferase family 4 protein n=1 Tax=Vagococcus jeotgali TaxID=3109030 RepID=UPI002DD9414B|nr:glycosyltransferase family 4 protein [Vagococcus sp. B2T-5]